MWRREEVSTTSARLFRKRSRAYPSYKENNMRVHEGKSIKLGQDRA